MLHDKTKTAENEVTKLGTEIVLIVVVVVVVYLHDMTQPQPITIPQLILGQKVKGQGHTVTGVSYAFCHVPSL